MLTSERNMARAAIDKCRAGIFSEFEILKNFLKVHPDELPGNDGPDIWAITEDEYRNFELRYYEAQEKAARQVYPRNIFD